MRVTIYSDEGIELATVSTPSTTQRYEEVQATTLLSRIQVFLVQGCRVPYIDTVDFMRNEQSYKTYGVHNQSLGREPAPRRRGSPALPGLK